MKHILNIYRWWQRVWHIGWVVAIALCLLLPLTPHAVLATGVADVPPLSAGSSTWVIDQGDVLSVLTKGAIERKLSKLAQQTGNEVRLVTIHRFDYGQTADTFTQELFERSFPTPALQANQAILFLDTQTNTTDLYVGEQLKPLLTEETARSIATETMLTPIRDGNYNQGLLDAVNRLSLVVSGQPDPGPPEVKVVEVESTFKSADETDVQGSSVLVIVLLLVATIVPMATYYWYQRG
jgi:uncharacterized protein